MCPLSRPPLRPLLRLLPVPRCPRRALPAAMAVALKSVDYEVHGIVQGVCFRRYTEQEANKVGVVGWVMNTSQGTVTGQLQGPEEKVNSIFPGQAQTDLSIGHEESDSSKRKDLTPKPAASQKTWLSKVGSPSSRIDRANFSNEKNITKLDYSNFSIRY
ncbi:acylphosphatase-2 isoform X1 [Sorex fumeus]|uniref:acylphosphatase-2 isoform X1 n=1 Tax=Sorex fumeus TaxID=62283 RepID=UPI0024AC9A6D|nr:acylphosphatase-2 isoform X1 [Sorex fumeus]